MTYVIMLLMMINGVPTWVKMPSKTLDTGKKEVFYTYSDCKRAAEESLNQLKPRDVLDFSCKKVN